MSKTTRVRVKGTHLEHFLLILLLLLPVSAAVVVPTVFGPSFAGVLVGERPMDIIIVLYPVIILALVGLAIFVGLQVRETWDPISFSENSFSRHGSSYSYNSLRKIYPNPSESHMVLLFEEPLGESNTIGIEIRKDRIDPSLGDLISLLRKHNVEMNETDTFPYHDLQEMQNEVWKQTHKDM